MASFEYPEVVTYSKLDAGRVSIRLIGDLKRRTMMNMIYKV